MGISSRPSCSTRCRSCSRSRCTRRRTATSPSSSATAPPWMLGRVSLNPIRHIDPVGTVGRSRWRCYVLSGGGFIFGWAKPVPVNFDEPAPPQARHALGGGGGSRRQPRHGAALGDACCWRRGGAGSWEFWIRVADAGHHLERQPRGPEPVPAAAARRRPHPGEPAARTASPTRYSRLEPYGMFILLILVATADPGLDHAPPDRGARPGAGLLAPRPSGPLSTMFQDRVFPACAPRAGCTSATTTARSRTGCGCRTSTRASSSRPTGTRSPRTTRTRRSSSRRCGTCSSTGWPPASIRPRRRCSCSRACREHAELTLLLVDLHAARLARARADLQGPAVDKRRARTATSRPTGSWATR